MKLQPQITHLLSKVIPLTPSELTSGKTETVCVLPAGAIVTAVKVITTTVFNGGATNTLVAGDQVTANAYANAATMGAVGNVAGTAPVRRIQAGVNDKVNITPTFTTAPTAGEAFLCLEFFIPTYTELQSM